MIYDAHLEETRRLRGVSTSHARCGAFPIRGERDRVLTSHGFTGTTQSGRPLGEELAEEGFTVMGPRLEGHGTSIEASPAAAPPLIGSPLSKRGSPGCSSARVRSSSWGSP